jgi:hypothetical protein
MSKPNKELLKELMALTITELLEQIRSGEANPTVLNVARQLLKDNQITCSVDTDSPLKNLVDILPFDDASSSEREHTRYQAQGL